MLALDVVVTVLNIPEPAIVLYSVSCLSVLRGLLVSDAVVAVSVYRIGSSVGKCAAAGILPRGMRAASEAIMTAAVVIVSEAARMPWWRIQAKVQAATTLFIHVTYII